MNKQQYITNRFKRDFLQYSLLQKNSLSAKEIAERLFEECNLEWLVNQCEQEIKSLKHSHLSFERIKVDGRLSNDLPSELDYDLKDRILTEYKYYLDSHSTEEIAHTIISKIERSIELQSWSNGIVNMQEAIKLLVERLNNSTKSYDNLYVTPISENDIFEKFNKAKENTILERIQGNNIDDIVEYRSALMDYIQVSCENMLHAKLKEIYSNIAKDSSFCRLQANVSHLLEYAHELNSSIINCEPNEQWDKEYDHHIPAEFYYRNVENITAEQAFQMIIFQSFAKNESWMIENGLLENGELKIFVGDNPLHLKEVLNSIIDAIL